MRQMKKKSMFDWIDEDRNFLRGQTNTLAKTFRAAEHFFSKIDLCLLNFWEWKRRINYSSANNQNEKVFLLYY